MKTLHLSIIAIFSIVFIFSNNSVFADSMKSTDSFLQKCNDNISPIPTLIPSSENSSSPKQGILVMQPNSVAIVCIKYVKLSHGNSSFETNNTQLIPSIGIEDIHVHGNQVSFGTILVNNVIAKAQQKTISFSSQENASTVILYALSAKSDSRGYYHLGIPYMCGNILLAVGYPVSQIDASAFQDLDPMCFNYGVETSIVGIQGANMTYVDSSHEATHSTKLPENISIIPPLQQMRIYDNVKFIQCNPDLQLIFKSEDGSTACVKSDTAQKLVERGWGMAVTTNIQQNVPTLSSSITVQNTNFTISYDFAGNGKILDANMDTQSKSLILSLETTSNGTLTVSIPRALLDIKKNDRGMGEFYMLADGQETIFKEIHTTPTDRIFSIPFQNGTSKIMIIAVELI